MATGLVIRNAQGQTVQVPFDQLQTNYPDLYSKYIAGVAQPGASLAQTQASTGLTGQEAANAALTNKISQSKVNQLQAINNAGEYFQSHADKNGYVSPQDYNTFLAKYTQSGGDSQSFHDTFANQYVNPKNVLYDTPDAKAARSALPVIKNVIDSYHKLGLTGQAVSDLGNIPILGKYLKQTALLSAQTAHDALLNGEIGNIRQIAGAGPNQGFRFNLNELNNIAGLLPSAEDNKSVANAKLDNLDSFLRDNMGIGLKDIYGK